MSDPVKLFSVKKGNGPNDFTLSYFSGQGAGGQKRNKVQACVRMTHTGSGVRVTAQRERSRISNERAALHQLAKHPRFVKWARAKAGGEIEAFEKWHKEMVDRVELDLLNPDKTIVEVFSNGKWAKEECKT